MKKNNIIYWTTTGLMSFIMAFSAFSYFTDAKMIATFTHLGFPDYFRKELAVAKIIGVLALLIPQIPIKLKEWAYAGFGIVFISASVAHLSMGDTMAEAIVPTVFLIILLISNIYLQKTKKKYHETV